MIYYAYPQIFNYYSLARYIRGRFAYQKRIDGPLNSSASPYLPVGILNVIESKYVVSNFATL